MAVPTFIQTKTAASDASAATSHAITPDSAIRAQGGAVGPSAGVVTCSFDGDPGTVTGTDTAGNTWVVGASAGSGSTYGAMLYTFNMIPAGTTITVATTNSVKAKLAFAELDQVAPISPYDGTSSPLDTVQARVDTPAVATTVRTSAPSSPAPADVKSMMAVRIGGMAWNNTKTVSSTSAWTGLVQLSGGSSNLGVAIERKASEILNLSGGNSRASFTMSASDTQPSAVMSLTFYRDGTVTIDDDTRDGTTDNIENVVTATTNNSTNIIYRSSASAPGGGTGSSQMSRYFGILPRYYSPTGATIGSGVNLRLSVISGDDSDTNFGFWLDTYKQDQLGASVDTGDENKTGDRSNYNITTELGASVVGSKTISLTYATDINATGRTGIQVHSEGDGFGFGTGNWVELGDKTGRSPAFLIFSLTYPSLSTPTRTLLGVGL